MTLHVFFTAMLDQVRNPSRPSRLVAGPDTRSIIAMEVLVEEMASRQKGSSWNLCEPHRPDVGRYYRGERYRVSRRDSSEAISFKETN